MMKFSELNISGPLLNALTDEGLTDTTTIQEKAFPVIMSGRDMVGIAQTGTGKTIAYLLPCLRMWKYTKEKNPTIVVVVPTRELVSQVAEQAKQLTACMPVRIAGVYGGVNMKQQAPLIQEGVDLLVGTPGRLLDLVLNGVLKLRDVKRFIIDEVDEMLDLGFRPQLMRIIDLLPARRQNLMFSATITPDLQLFIRDFFIDPVEVEAARTGTPLEKIQQQGFYVPNFNTKVNFLKLLLEQHSELSKVLVITSTKKTADLLFDRLEDPFADGLGVIHSNKSQNNRFLTLEKFNSNRSRILIATDIVARGLDFDEVTHVVNFDIPEIPEDYIHRIGRTGRADKAGVALAFITKEDEEKIKAIERLMGKSIPLSDLPDEVEISDILIEDELPQVKMKNILAKPPKKEETGPAFHEKKDKNKKVNQKVRRSDAMRKKYGKPKTRGQKRK